MKAEEFDKRFDNAEDIIEFLDLSKASRPGLGQRSVRIDFPDWMVQGIDQEAKRLGLDPSDNPLKGLSDAIEEHMTKLGAEDVKEYAIAFFKSFHYAIDHPDIPIFETGIEMILNDRVLPDIDSAVFAVTMSYLAKSLKDKKYNGDVGVMLAELLTGKISQAPAREPVE
ncbi:hypothetical protein NC981_14880 [Leptolyngbya sp. DQ-M1]|uniref:type II toxin-antitoxin system BrnA family antitoxin n=1 Tax=Leptolyngbya sp. DQ-M1 TaxID=2933920 RepID=UPI00329849DD